jgi:endosialidase-like protein
MPAPPAYDRDYSFTDWETTHPGEPKPGSALDTEFDDVSNALTATQDALALIQRDDGALANDSVGPDQLQDDVFNGIVDGITDEATAQADRATAQADLAAASATSANTANTNAQTAASNAAGSAANAVSAADIAATARDDANTSAVAADASADLAGVHANETAGSVAAAQLHEETAEKWADYMPGPVEAVDDGRFSAKWWAVRAEEFNSTSDIDLGSGQADIGAAFLEWDAIPGNDLPIGQVYATWGSPPHTYVLTEHDAPEDPDSWTDITGGPGPANVLSIGTTTTLPPGSAATATITGVSPAQTLSLGIPEGVQGALGPQGPIGADGPQGIPGPANTLTIGTVTTGTPSSATITGASPAQVLNLRLEPGPANSLTIGTVTTGTPGSAAAASISGTPPNQVLNLTIPTGAAATLGNPTAQIGLTAINGSAATAMRSDAAPALNVGISPTWTGIHTFQQNVTIQKASTAAALRLTPVSTSQAQILFDAATAFVIQDMAAGATRFQIDGATGNVTMLQEVISGTRFRVGSTPVSSPGLSSISITGGNALEWGHSNNAGYRSTLGYNTSNGSPFVGLSAEAGTTANLYRTRGKIGWIVRNNLTATPVFEIGHLATASADDQSLTVDMSISSAGVVDFTSTPTVAGVPISGGASVADPTGTIGLAAVNGVAATSMRSDASPPLSQAIAPTWSAKHTFSSPFVAGTLSSMPILVSSANPAIFLNNTGATADRRLWGLDVAASGALSGRLWLDAASGSGVTWLNITTSAGPAINALTLSGASIRLEPTDAAAGAIRAGAIEHTAGNVLLNVIRAAGAHNLIAWGQDPSGGNCGMLGSNTDLKLWLAFNAEKGTTANTFRTRGVKGYVIRSNLLGGIEFGRAPTASADNQALTVDMTISAAGVVNFVSAPTVAGSAFSGAPAGSDTQIQYNNAGALAGNAGLTYDTANQRIILGTTALSGELRGALGTAAGGDLFVRGGSGGTSTGGKLTLSGGFAGSNNIGGSVLVCGSNGSATRGNAQVRGTSTNSSGAFGDPPTTLDGSVLIMAALADGTKATAGVTYIYGGGVASGTSAAPADVEIHGGNAGTNTTTRAGGNVKIYGGYAGGSTPGTPGYISILTGGDVNTAVPSTERLRILGNGAWSVGSAGTDTGTAGQILTSNGSGSPPTWQAAAGISVPIRIADGTAAAPSYSFTNSNNQGMYRVSSTVLGFAVSGVVQLQVGAGSQLQFSNWKDPNSLASIVWNTGSPVAYGTVIVSGLVSGYAGIVADDGTIRPTLMSNASSAGIYNQGDSKWLWQRTSSTAADSGYNVAALSFNATSSRAIKRETGKPTRAADILSRLRPILYRLLADDSREQIGLIAEEVHEVCPQLSDGKTVSYDRLALLLLADWQETRAAA